MTEPTPKGAGMDKWPTKPQLDIIEDIAWKYGGVSVDHVRGDDTLVKVQYELAMGAKCTRILEPDGNDLQDFVETPANAVISVPVDLVVRVVGTWNMAAALGSATKHAMEMGHKEMSEGYIGAFLTQEFSKQLAGLLNELDARQQDAAREIEQDA